jgi:TPP-dependent pyruvate/acetoin dehydrogenase alpha subunit
VLVVENNLYAYSTPNAGEFACKTLAERGPGYGTPAECVDGTDVLAVHDAVKRAVARARTGAGPSLVEARALRLRGHSEADDHAYVPREALEEGRRKDPLARFELMLREQGLLDDAAIAAAREEAERALEGALEAALALPAPDPSSLAWGRWSEEGHPTRGKDVPGRPGLAGDAFPESRS